MPETLLMIRTTDGESGEVLMSDVPAALKSGIYQRGVKLRAPNNSIVVAPLDSVALYLDAGFKLIPD